MLLSLVSTVIKYFLLKGKSKYHLSVSPNERIATSISSQNCIQGVVEAQEIKNPPS